MLLSQLIALQWKEATRSRVWQKELVINILLGLFLLYMLLNVLVLGLFLDKILLSVFPDENPVAVLNRFLLYYLLFDLLTRFYLQELPVIRIQPFLHLPIRKSSVIHYLLGKSLLSFFNFLPLLVVIPFGLRVIPREYSTTAAWVWITALFTWLLINNFITVWLKKQLVLQARWVVLFALVYAAVLVFDYLHVFSLSEISERLFGVFLQNPAALLVPVAVLLLLYVVNFRFLQAHTYPEEIGRTQAVQDVATGNIAFLRRFGMVGELLSLELKLIWRHKRPRSVALVSFLFIPYGLFFYTNKTFQDMNSFLIFVGVFITGMFMLNYGQFMLSWVGGHFDGLLTQNLRPFVFLQAKFWLFAFSCVLYFMLSLPYAFISWKIVALNLAALLFNIGVNAFMVLYFSMMSPKKIDLSRGTFFNYQGVGASQFILMIPVLLLPVILYLLFKAIGGESLGIVMLGAVGLVGFFFHKTCLRLLEQRFIARKYAIAAGFRAE